MTAHNKPNKPFTRGRTLDHVAWLYDPVIEKLSFGKEARFREKTIEHMDFIPTDTILDVGCGTGSLTLAVARRLNPPGEIVGIDAAPKMIEIARTKAAKAGVRARFEVGVAESLSFSDETFNLVVNSMFMHHIDAELKRFALSEIYRVLKPGGALVTADVDKPTTLWGKLLGWGARYLLVQKELADNLSGRIPLLTSEAGFIEVRRVDHVYGLVSFFTARKPESPA
jgi:ubiquinone/menaquinone biosynthesis C-methylase UbiE